MTITTTDEKLARQLEPYAPRPSLRIEAISRLTSKGIRVVGALQSFDAADQRLPSEHRGGRPGGAGAGAVYLDGGRAVPEALRSKGVLSVSRRKTSQHSYADIASDTKGAISWMATTLRKCGTRRETRERYGLTRKPNRLSAGAVAGRTANGSVSLRSLDPTA